MKTPTAIHWSAWPIVVAPLVLFVLLLLLPQVPRAFDLMPEHYTPPRYQPYTTWLLVLCALYAYPVTLVFIALGLQRHVFHPVHLADVGAYSLLLSYAAYRLFARIRRTTKRPNQAMERTADPPLLR